MSEYVELHARSAFSFLRAASFPEQLAMQAATVGLEAVALCDRDGVYGAPRFHAKGKEYGVRGIVGAELTFRDGSVLPVLVKSQVGYRNLSRLITEAKLRGTKHDAPVDWADLEGKTDGLFALTGDEDGAAWRLIAERRFDEARAYAEKIIRTFGKKNVAVEVQRRLIRGEDIVTDSLFELAKAIGLPTAATNGVLYALEEQQRVLDVFTCARVHTHLDAAGRQLQQNSSRFLKSPAQMRELFRDHPKALTNTRRIAEQLEFGLENLGYHFPKYPVPPGESMDTFLRRVTMAGARSRYSHLGPKVKAQLKRELDLIEKLGFAGYFLIVWDICNFCTDNNILVQGRGSAANSVVCYSLGITACDPIACELLFERFLSEGRKSWPDIDLDLPSGERREAVIQEVYRRYGKHGAAMTANVITFRGRSAMREIGKALNFSAELLDRFSKLFAHGDFPETLQLHEQMAKAGLPPTHPRFAVAAELYQSIYGLPRHLGQHSGGMIICQNELSAIVPLENASMPGRVVAQWDKDDCEDLGIVKVDLLGLGMMAAMQDSLEVCAARGKPVDLASIPKDDTRTFDLLCAADTIGTFQVESRAQMATLPRLQPRCFYDIVVEVALIRPGPIQGNMVHPYLARRDGKEAVTYFDPRLEPVLKRTLGVPLFQEQLLKIAMVMADFSGTEAEELRRALSFHRSQEKMNAVCAKLRVAMEHKGVAPAVVDDIVRAVQSFAVYGFPESHAISFGLIAYASCWMKVHRTVEFYAGLLNNQPMGFYSPATLLADAKRRGVKIRPVDVVVSDWLSTIEADNSLRLGLGNVRSLRREDGERIVAERQARSFTSMADFQLRAALPKASQRNLAKIGALNGLADHRRDAQWRVEIVREEGDLFATAESAAPVPLAPMNARERMAADYSGTGLSTGPHPMALIRQRMNHELVWRASDLPQANSGTFIRVAGQVICRQRPGTAKGFVFISLEDETGTTNCIVTPTLFERRRLTISEEPFLIIEGLVQNVDRVIHVKAVAIRALRELEAPTPPSHDFK